MPTYLSPGVYVEEKLSGTAPIVGVGTSTAGFIGVFQAVDLTLDVDLIVSADQATDKKIPLPLPAGFSGPAADPSWTKDSKPVFTLDGTARPDGTITLDNKLPVIAFTDAVAAPATLKGTYKLKAQPTDQVVLCTNFGEFKKSFGDFSTTPAHNQLAHAVFGFFRNGGTRCFVVRVAAEANIQSALDQFEAIDEIALVLAPGVTTKAQLGAIADHCKNLGDRFAIFDSPANVTDLNTLEPGASKMPGSSDYAALYFPWITVFDQVSKAELAVPPSGHIAGLYARVDSQRGVFKAPANETILGAVGLTYNVSKAKQDGLNPQGINCIRSLNGNIRVWGARTYGGDDNGEFKYISVRRLFNYLRESIDEGTQWIVFEPNSPELWAKIRRTLTAFLTVQWRSGALFGTTPEQAFYVKCDEETNPPEIRDLGQVVTEIGVAVVKPAEFVIFQISQLAGPGGQ
jgi:uncharacterized protein